MERTYSVLIVDDHPLICAAYRSALYQFSGVYPEYNFEVDVVGDCESAHQKIVEASKDYEKRIDIFFLDIRLPPTKDGKIRSGEDLGIIIRELLDEDVRIIISTTFNDNYRMHNILKSVNPDGFLIKNDIVPRELITAINDVINDPPYYSKTVLKLMQKQVINEFVLDPVDRQLLYELSVGTKTKELPDIIGLSMGAIEKRKRSIKVLFEIDTFDDRELVRQAKDRGFI